MAGLCSSHTHTERSELFLLPLSFPPLFLSRTPASCMRCQRLTDSTKRSAPLLCSACCFLHIVVEFPVPRNRIPISHEPLSHGLCTLCKGPQRSPFYKHSIQALNSVVDAV